jgi:hypothetical protein
MTDVACWMGTAMAWTGMAVDSVWIGDAYDGNARDTGVYVAAGATEVYAAIGAAVVYVVGWE